MIHFTTDDWEFLAALGIKTESADVHVARPDGTVRLLQKYGILVTRENYLRLAFAGNPPQEPLDGEIEAELPMELRPSYTTPRGFSICSECGKSTRNRNALVCAPCRNRTRLLLTAEDRKLLREMGIAR